MAAKKPASKSKDKPAPAKKAAASTQTLAIDIGGTGLKASILDENGEMVTDRVRVETPQPASPDIIVDALVKLVPPLPAYGRVSVGFPGVVRKGKIVTAPNLGQAIWQGFDLASTLSEKLGKPVKVKNDADVQGLGAIKGDGVEMVITLGTGFGTSIFEDGYISAHLELAHHAFRKDQTYEEQLGNAALQEVGKKRWNKRVQRAITSLRNLTNFDRLYIGGGNAKKLDFKLPADVEIVSNELGMRGGIWLWKERR